MRDRTSKRYYLGGSFIEKVQFVLWLLKDTEPVKYE